MKIFDKATIENFAQKVDEEVVETSLSTFSFITEQSMEDFKKSNAFITANYELAVANEFCSGAVLPNSRIDLLLILKSPQLELNTSKLLNNKFKSFWTRLKHAWKNRKKKSKKRKKKDKYIAKTKEVRQIDKAKYNISNFNMDLLNHLSNHLEKDCVVSLGGGVIEIGGQRLPFSCRIFPVFDRGGTYNFYLDSRNKFFNIDFQKRELHLEELVETYGERYLELCQIFSGLYFNLTQARPNALFIESLVANLPKDAFFYDSVYESFVFAVNYITNTKQSNFFAITNTSTRLIDEKLCGVTALEISSFMKNLQKYL